MRKKVLNQRLLDASNVIEFIAKRNFELFQEREKWEQRNDALVSEVNRLRQENSNLNIRVINDVVAPKKVAPAKGPDRPNRPKLTDRDVKDIRKAYHNGMKQRDLADNYGVNRSTISRIVRGIYH